MFWLCQLGKSDGNMLGDVEGEVVGDAGEKLGVAGGGTMPLSTKALRNRGLLVQC